MLTATKIRRTSKPGIHTDGPGRYGLFLVVKEGAHRLRKTFSQRVTISGKRTMIGLGKVEFVTLAEARSMAFDNARSLARGGELVHGGQRRAGATVARVVPTFAEAAETYIQHEAAGWKASSRTEGNWRSSLAHAAPIAAVKVDAVDGDAVVGIVRKLVDTDKAPTAKAVAQRIKAILAWATDEGHRTGPNPVNGRVDRELARGRHRTKHHESIPAGEVPRVYAAAASITDPRWQGLTGAFRLMVLTACRTSEVLGARWSEVDLEARTWTIPEGRMKGGYKHRVPLSDEAISVLEAARKRTGGKGLVFLSPSRKAIGDDGLRRVMKGIGANATPHGFRGSFKTWAMESGVLRDVAEFSVAHRSHMCDSEASYVRTDLLEKRRPVMERWGRHVAGSEAPKVVAIGGGAV